MSYALAAGVSSPPEAPDGGYEFYRRREDGNKNGQRQDPFSRSSPISARRGFKFQAQDPARVRRTLHFFHFGFTASGRRRQD
ncbi:hypothetical protein E4U17_007692 [Claviceps sp. LM77 group G4]|nr:hypothetical protein E4U33_000159 [Claviceps sp. LM78 group G4]KAG6058676.1 hypothetical protein E4U17_007692 [Claviceps sp. LM77 group G4]KAG6077831.1 hypothetical protein E4U16_001987 [Claviceps sp. LM84 group G4]